MPDSRSKGKGFEYEVIQLHYDELGIKLKRDIEQYRVQDHGDLISEDADFPFAIECKRRRKGFLPDQKWWVQTCTAANMCRKIPILIYRFDRLPVRVRVPMSILHKLETEERDWRYVTDMDFDTYAMIAREML
jgi:hypothetical protein